MVVVQFVVNSPNDHNARTCTVLNDWRQTRWVQGYRSTIHTPEIVSTRVNMYIGLHYIYNFKRTMHVQGNPRFPPTAKILL